MWVGEDFLIIRLGKELRRRVRILEAVSLGDNGGWIKVWSRGKGVGDFCLGMCKELVLWLERNWYGIYVIIFR